MNEENKVEEGITLGDLVHVVFKNIFLLIGITLLVTIIGVVYTFGIAEEKYKSTSTIIVAITNEGDDSLDYTNSSKLIYTITDLVKQDIVLESVAEENNLKTKDLKEMVEVSYTSNSYLVKISVVSVDPLETKDLANAIVARLIQVVETEEAFAFAKGAIKQTSAAQDGLYDSPNKMLYCLIAVVASGVIGLVVVFVKEFASSKYTSKQAIENDLQEQVVGTFYDNAEKGKKIDNDNKVVDLIEPNVRNFEQYNRLISNIKYSNLENPYKVIMFTSTSMNELKSTTCANLAYSLAHNHKKVVIIDLDVRKPVLYKTFKVERSNGLVEFIEGSINKKDLIKHSESGVDVVTTGKKVINPMVVIEAQALKDLIKELREEYDYVLIDTPPLALCTDALVIGQLCDGIVYNVAINTAKKRDVKESLKSLKTLDAKVIGLNITKVKASKRDIYYLEYQSQ